MKKPFAAGLSATAAAIVAVLLVVGAGGPESLSGESALPTGDGVILAPRGEAGGRIDAPIITAQSDIGTAVRDYLRSNPDLLSPPASGAGGFSDAEKAEIGAIIRDYLIENPEVIRDAMAALERKRIAEEEAAQLKALTANRERILNSEHQVVLGNPAGTITLVEFFDYNCTYCRRAHADMKRLLAEDPDLRVVLKEFPVLGPGSTEAAQVGVALSKVAPEKYAEFHDRMLTDSAAASGNRALAIAESIGVDRQKLLAIVNDPVVKDSIDEVYGIANELGLTGTPTYVVGDQIVVGAVGYETLREKIDDAREACETVSC